MDSYTIVLATTPVVDGAGSTSTFGGTVVTATENAQYDLSNNNVGFLIPPRTSTNTTVLTTTATSAEKIFVNHEVKPAKLDSNFSTKATSSTSNLTTYNNKRNINYCIVMDNLYHT